jgi:hypothetical protein
MWMPLLLLLGEEGGTACVAGVFLVCASWALGVGQLMSADNQRAVLAAVAKASPVFAQAFAEKAAKRACAGPPRGSTKCVLPCSCSVSPRSRLERLA